MSVVFSFTAILLVCFPGPLVAGTEVTGGKSAAPVHSDLDIDLKPGDWLHDFKAAKALATEQQLPLLLHFEASWCGPCRKMESDVLNKPQVLQLLGSRVVGVRIDADRHAELISEFGIKTLPTEVLVQPDGTRGDLQTGALSLTSYVARLERLSAGSPADTAVAAADTDSDESAKASEATRSCLIVERDGKMVGLGGFSPVALQQSREWKTGSEEFVVNHEGVDYFLQSADEASLFRKNPNRYIPRLHGCDLVELYSQNRARTGAIEYGAFYEGELFFFSSLENRTRFQNQPSWYIDMTADGSPVNAEAFPFLQPSHMD